MAVLTPTELAASLRSVLDWHRAWLQVVPEEALVQWGADAMQFVVDCNAEEHRRITTVAAADEVDNATTDRGRQLMGYGSS